MGARLIAVAVACLLASCVHDELVACDDGRLCPVGTACDLVHATCVAPAQTVACGSLVDGDVCSADGVTGICDRDVCVPGCGDGRQDSGEECDDGNFGSHDGCSSACLREQATWQFVPSPWKARQGHVAAYMTAQQQLVVFGGTNGSTTLDDQWQRDASGTWSEFTGPRPPARRDAVMVYDASTQRLVLFGGMDPDGHALADTWEFDGAAWFHGSPVMSPPARSKSAMVYSTAGGYPLLFGGVGSDIGMLDDTWAYEATSTPGVGTWTELVLSVRPQVRSGHAMTWDPSRNVVVLFGGAGGFLSNRNDTWELTIFGWVERTIAGPPPRDGAVFAYSSARGKAVLFGGRVSSEASDTWEYDGSQWTQVMTGVYTPPARLGATAVADSGGLVLMIGGTQTFSDVLDDAWEYSAQGTWTDRTPQLTPSSRTTPIVYDLEARRVMLAAGVGAGFPYDAWAFDAGWHQLPLPPEGRFDHALAYDETRRRTLLFGGMSHAFQPTATTYAFDSATSTWAQIAGAAPMPRVAAAFGYDGSLGGMLMFGGNNAVNTDFMDTWELVGDSWTQRPQLTSPATGTSIAFDARHGYSVLVDNEGVTWTYRDHAWSVLPVEAVPVEDEPSVVYDSARERVVLLDSGVASGVLHAWELSDTGWVELDVAGLAPEARTNTGFAYDRRRRAYVTFGGQNPGRTLDDTWRLQYHSLTPDEICDNAIDDDGDRHVDAADPDCN